MAKLRLLIILAILFSSCSSKNKDIPVSIYQYAENMIEASINTYPPEDFYQSNFDPEVAQEYIDGLKQNALAWNGKEHNTELRHANLVDTNAENAEYLLKYWLTFKDGRKFSYTIDVIDKNGKLTLRRFEPMDVDMAKTIYSPNNKFDIPNFASNRFKIYFAYTAILLTLFILIGIVIRKRRYLLLLAVPLLFIHKLGMTIFTYKGINVLSPELKFGLPLFKNLDLHFTAIKLSTTGVFYVWAIIALYLIWTIWRSKKAQNETVGAS